MECWKDVHTYSLWKWRRASQGEVLTLGASRGAREGYMASPVEHAACGEDQEPVVERCHCDRVMWPGVELQLPAFALPPARVQVQDGSEAPVVHALIAVVVQWKAAAVACMQHSQPCSRCCCPLYSLYNYCMKVRIYQRLGTSKGKPLLPCSKLMFCMGLAQSGCCTCVELHLCELLVQREAGHKQAQHCQQCPVPLESCDDRRCALDGLHNCPTEMTPVKVTTSIAQSQAASLLG